MPPNRRDTDRAAVPRAERHYVLGFKGFVHTANNLVSPRTSRAQAVLLLSACGRPFRLTTDGNELLVNAAVVGPLVMRALDARGVDLVSIHVAPSHHAFPTFARAFHDDVRVLRRERFAPWNEALRQVVSGPAELKTADHLFDTLVSLVQVDHCDGPMPDDITDHVLQLLHEDLELPLEVLAQRAKVPPQELGRRFQHSVGLPLRVYQAWLRTARAWPLFAREKHLSLTEIAYQAGYSDSSHLSRSWRQIYGVSPSHMRSEKVHVIR